jgi:hypothetical protein
MTGCIPAAAILAPSFNSNTTGAGTLSLIATLSPLRWQHFPLGKARAAFDSLGLLAAVLLLMLIITMLTSGGPDFEGFASLSGGSILRTALNLYAEQLQPWVQTLGPPLPLAVLALNLAPSRGWRRIAWVTATAVMYAIAANALCIWFFGSAGATQLYALPIFLVAIFEFRSRAAISAGDLMRRQIDAAAMDAELTQARLQMLRAQVEPHFLFNTLANVRTMAHGDPLAAAEAIGHLIRYLEAALPRLRSQESQLAEERTLIDAYLRIHQMRMGSRLDYRIEIPDTLSEVRVPSMMLLTLIENAIKHGLNPLSQGGHIDVRARAVAGKVELSVSDSGRGVGSSVESGTGTGLANIRARLNLQYGSAAQLTLARRVGSGTTVAILLPQEASSLGQVG